MGRPFRVRAHYPAQITGAQSTYGRARSRLPPPCRYNRYRVLSLPESRTALPLYAYRCTTCGNKFEKIQNFSAEPETVCPKCGNATLIRPLTAPRLNFKGAGWYINDYAPKGSDSSSETSSESKPAESKDATKSSEPASSASTTSSAPSAPASTPKPSTDS